MVVLETIIRDLQLSIRLERKEDYALRTVFMNPSKQTVSPPISPISSTENKKWFKYTEQSFGEVELDYWLQYGIDAKTLRQFGLRICLE